MRKMWTKTCAASVLLAVAACGRGGELSREQVVARGDAACESAAAELDPPFAELFPTGSETPPAKTAAPIMSRAADVIRAEADAFAAMTSVEDEETFGEIRRGMQRIADEFDGSAEKARAGDTEGYLQALEHVNGVDADVREVMREYGFDECAGEA
jgi:acyl-CoA reductase-like NAD-dependent aldehyde dehydrogenase